ncbi:hypothetical protein GF325_11325 [Candidatus Bathyarchaeota archaeon]|nr:hypothetical protein [Candidatus Bathyarchaeota archaeon]
MADGFFKSITLEIARVINKHFSDGAIIEVKHIRKVMGISSRNRSKIIFISRALQTLSDKGSLEYVGRNSPKKYKKVEHLDISAIKGWDI